MAKWGPFPDLSEAARLRAERDDLAGRLQRIQQDERALIAVKLQAAQAMRDMAKKEQGRT